MPARNQNSRKQSTLTRAFGRLTGSGRDSKADAFDEHLNALLQILPNASYEQLSKLEEFESALAQRRAAVAFEEDAAALAGSEDAKFAPEAAVGPVAAAAPPPDAYARIMADFAEITERVDLANSGDGYEHLYQVLAIFLKSTHAEAHAGLYHKCLQVFEQFTADGSHGISLHDMQHAFRKVGVHIPSKHLDHMLREVDTDGDGRVSFEEFHAAATKNLRPTTRRPPRCATGSSARRRAGCCTRSCRTRAAARARTRAAGGGRVRARAPPRLRLVDHPVPRLRRRRDRVRGRVRATRRRVGALVDFVAAVTGVTFVVFNLEIVVSSSRAPRRSTSFSTTRRAASTASTSRSSRFRTSSGSCTSAARSRASRSCCATCGSRAS